VKPTILRGKEEREGRVVSGSLSRRGALGGLTALSLVRAASAQDLTKASIALLRLSSSGPIFIAQEKGWFKDAGLDLTLKDFQAAAQVPLAVVSGDADLGVTAFTAGFYNLAAKGGLVVVAAQSAERPGYQLNVIAVTNAAWDAGMHSVSDLVGKRVAVSTVGSSVHYSLEIVARKHGVDTKRLTIVPLQSIPNMVAAFKGGQVDAAVFPITTFRQVEAEGSGKPIAYVGDEVPWQLGAVFTSPKTIADRRPVVEKFLVGYRHGAAAYHEAFGQRENGKLAPGPNFDEMIGILSSVLKQPPALVASGLPYIDPEGRLDVGDIYKQVAFWQSTGQVARDADPKSFIDLSFVSGHFNVPK
jgi:NitT/TauT family transport system substrate-binding protein